MNSSDNSTQSILIAAGIAAIIVLVGLVVSKSAQRRSARSSLADSRTPVDLWRDVRQPAPMHERDLTLLPARVQDAARVLDNGEVMWPVGEADRAIEALAAVGRVVLGADVREYQPDGSFSETAWSSFEPGGVDDAAGGCRAALSALHREPLPGEWVLVTWR